VGQGGSDKKKNPLAGAERGFFDWSENPRYGVITPTTRRMTRAIGESLRMSAVCCGRSKAYIMRRF
jgi:hypothetical protein